MTDPRRKQWNEGQQKLQNALKRSAQQTETVDLFLSQHAALHDHAVSASGTAYSFSEALWDGLSEPAARRIPKGMEHSIAWIVWHLARIEDMTMNVLLAGAEQVFNPQWQARMGGTVRDTGSSMDAEQIARMSGSIELAALREYRCAVGRSTQTAVKQMDTARLAQKVDAARIERLRAAGDVLPEAGWLLAYWGSRTIAGLLLMPPTRHNFVHLNEAMKIKHKS